MSVDLRNVVASLPLPVGVAVGRVIRARDAADRLEAVLTAGEVLSRYVAVAAVSSAATREDPEVVVELGALTFDPARGLAWGAFNNLARRAMATPDDHLLRGSLARGFGQTGSQEPAGIDALEAMVQIRNEQAHALSAGGAIKAGSVLDSESGPEAHLVTALRSFDPFLRLSLVVIDEQRKQNRLDTARISLLRGEHPPFPFNTEAAGSADDGIPYIVTRQGLLPLTPGMIWAHEPGRWTMEPWFLDKVDAGRRTYRGLHSGQKLEAAHDANNDPLAWFRNVSRGMRQLLTRIG